MGQGQSHDEAVGEGGQQGRIHSPRAQAAGVALVLIGQRLALCLVAPPQAYLSPLTSHPLEGRDK